MALQDNSGTCTSYIAKWESGSTPKYSSSNGGTWTFSFANGGDQNGCTSGRKLDLDFICSSSVSIKRYFIFYFSLLCFDFACFCFFFFLQPFYFVPPNDDQSALAW